MRFNTISIFPETFDLLENYGVVGKAIEKGKLQINSIDLRDFASNKHKSVDDEIYGGGPGMLMMAEPLYLAIESVREEASLTIYMSPQGQLLNNDMAQKLAQFDSINIVCGHYEGIDQRIIDNYIDCEISIGDYIVTGGELPAMVLIDVVARFIPGVVGKKESVKEDTFYNGLLKYPSYTRPRSFRGHDVPKVLLSGDHKKIEEWRKKKALEVTKKKRPDLLD